MDNKSIAKSENQSQATDSLNLVQNLVAKPNSADKPELTPEQAQALLTINGLQAVKESKDSKWLLTSVVIIVVIMLVATIYVGLSHSSKKTSISSSSKVSLPSKNNNPLSNGGSINQQVKYCSNIINASTVC
jgi:hypothetical protein